MGISTAKPGLSCSLYDMEVVVTLRLEPHEKSCWAEEMIQWVRLMLVSVCLFGLFCFFYFSFIENKYFNITLLIAIL